MLGSSHPGRQQGYSWLYWSDLTSVKRSPPVCCVSASCKPPGPHPPPQGTRHIIQAITHPGAVLLTPLLPCFISHQTASLCETAPPLLVQPEQIPANKHTSCLRWWAETKLDFFHPSSDEDDAEWNTSTIIHQQNSYVTSKTTSQVQHKGTTTSKSSSTNISDSLKAVTQIWW